MPQHEKVFIAVENRKYMHIGLPILVVLAIFCIVLLISLVPNPVGKAYAVVKPYDNNAVIDSSTEKITNAFESTSFTERIESIDENDGTREENYILFSNFLLFSDYDKDDMDTIIKRYIESPEDFPENSPIVPVKINKEEYIVVFGHGERITDEGIIPYDSLELVLKSDPLENERRFEIKFVNPDNYHTGIGSILRGDIYTIKDKAYVVVDEQKFEKSSNGLMDTSITGYQVYSPPTPYNQLNRDFVGIIPYNANYPLPSNAVSYLQAKLNNNVVPFFQANSEGTATYTFTLYPILVPNFNPQTFSEGAVIAAADPYIDYSQYDLAIIFSQDTCCSGQVGIGVFGSGSFASLAYYPTNEPLLRTVPTVWFDSSNPDTGQLTEFVSKHEISHALPVFSPSYLNNIFFNHAFRVLPHARGFLPGVLGGGAWPCPANGPTFLCTPHEYGDRFDVMGSGQGLFSHHRAVYDLGFRNTASVQSISNSGTYSLCSTNHPPPANCPQELLIQNPNGANLAVELIGTPLGPEYSLYQNCQNFFDSLVLRVTDLEQGGGLGNLVYKYSGGTYSGDVIYPASTSPSNCNLPTIFGFGSLIDFPLHMGQTITTPIGTITFQGLTNTATGKQATISLSYTSPTCLTGPPIIELIPSTNFQIYQQTLWPVQAGVNPVISVYSGSACATDTITLTTQVNVLGQIHSISSVVSVPSSNSFNANWNIYRNLAFPSSLSTVSPGTYPLTVTATPASNPTQTTTITDQVSIMPLPSPLEIHAIVQTNTCTDNDPIPFNLQNLGANFLSSNGAVVSPNPQIPGLPQTFPVADVCANYGQATDVVCSSNIPNVPPNYGGLLFGDCRFVMNSQYGYCYGGTCY